MRDRILLGIGLDAGACAAASAIARLHAKRFDERAVVITGGARGLGLALAREFASRGARLALFSRDAGELRRAREDLSAQGPDVLVIEGDVRVADDAKRANAAARAA